MPIQTPPDLKQPLEMWGGIECSYVRVRSEVRDQLALNGHAARLGDLDRIAALGVRALRYPILWERHATRDAVDWRWADERLARLKELGIRPILGLVHHGSGPLPGGLLDPDFVNGLARFARAVAERYPWIDAYTPINEPATTARFSGLYGLWHPHGGDVACFGQCFLNECLATRAAMKAIREVNPAAELVQTEDLGKTHSTPRLAYQAAYENERRWLTFDVLLGRVDPTHPVHAHLLQCGVSERDLASFVEDPCAPDIIGLNHYVTSERFLDERVNRYPESTHGGNGHEAYADVDAVRVRAEGLVGIGGLLRETWARYGRPIAVTEVQLACTREEQVRWVIETWQSAATARKDGVDVRAVTPWALLGSFDWDSLLVHARGSYENGAFDVRSPQPRLTAVGRAIASLASTGGYEHPVLSMPGWWRRPVRLEYSPVAAPATGPGTAFPRDPHPTGAPVVVFGSRGTLGQAFVRLCGLRGLPVRAFDRQQVDVTDEGAVHACLAAIRPWAVVNCAGYVRVDEAERCPEHCRRGNVTAAETVAAACDRVRARLATFSSHLVFGGEVERPYVETDRPGPLNCYGRSKHEAEQRVRELDPDALIVRTSAFFGPWDTDNFLARVLHALTHGTRFGAPSQFVVSPTHIPDLVNATLDLLIDGELGIWHLANRGAVSWYGWAAAIAAAAGLPSEHLVEARPAELGWIAARPRFSALSSERGLLLPPWEEAVERCLATASDLRNEAAA